MCNIIQWRNIGGNLSAARSGGEISEIVAWLAHRRSSGGVTSGSAAK